MLLNQPLSSHLCNKADAIQSGRVDVAQFTEVQLQAILAGEKKIPGYTWHHNAQASPNNMQLVPEKVHDAVKHVGEAALKKGN